MQPHLRLVRLFRCPECAVSSSLLSSGNSVSLKGVTLPLHALAMVLLSCFNFAAWAAPDGTADIATRLNDLASLDCFVPVGSRIYKGKNLVSASLTLRADRLKAVEFLAILTVNGFPYGPFSITLTPGDIQLKETFTWPINIPNGPTASIRLRLVALESSSKRGLEILDVTKDFNIAVRQPHHLHNHHRQGAIQKRGCTCEARTIKPVND